MKKNNKKIEKIEILNRDRIESQWKESHIFNVEITI